MQTPIPKSHEVSRFVFDQMGQVLEVLFCTLLVKKNRNSGFVVLEFVVESGEQYIYWISETAMYPCSLTFGIRLMFKWFTSSLLVCMKSLV